jgi:hypothetical protein
MKNTDIHVPKSYFKHFCQEVVSGSKSLRCWLGNLFKGVANVIIGAFNLVLIALEKFVNMSLIPINTLIDGLNLVPNVNIKKVRLNMPKIPNTTNAIIQII